MPSPGEARRGLKAPENPRPLLQFPMKSLEEQLTALLQIPGMEDELAKSTDRAKSSIRGKWTNIFDGKVCQELPTADGSRFFFPSDEELARGELRIGVTLGVDWFSYLRSQIAPSHTSCPMSFSIINLLAHHRYKTANLLLAGIMPGPKEANPDQCQRFLRPIINELLRLWRDGVQIATPKYLQGRLIRVALVAVVCDKPAAHKLGGFGSHNHRFFCTLCWITQDKKATPEAFKEDGFPARTNKQHRELQKEYLKCSSNSARDAFVKEHATRWSELHRLPYFDVCRMIVIDPMHNLFLGVVKTHFYHIWVQQNILRKTKELRSLHAILANLRMPARLGRLPSLIGEPAGGSLTADQWLIFITVVAPLAIPQLWQEYRSDEPAESLAKRRAQQISSTLKAKKEAAAAARKAQPDALIPEAGKRSRRPTQKAAEMDIDPDMDNGIDAGTVEDYDEYGLNPTQQKRRKKRAKASATTAEDEAIDNGRPCNLHPDDPPHLLKLSTALKILTGREILEADLVEADTLLREYTAELVQLYGPDVIRPNHHYATHTVTGIRNYGPLHEFWTFLFERLNKVLKSYKTPNHAGGELESSFFREFHRTVQEARLLGQGAREVEGSELQRAIQVMYRASADDHGTVQALSRELDAAREDDGIKFELSSRSEITVLPSHVYFGSIAKSQSPFPQPNSTLLPLAHHSSK
ncbi:hypothetical protein MSAN_00923800 [Mycena sanguinolenta]|uniref:Transposase domain-containing protein n=1 Tax=Mycena sanguinolenta TaxID=230812 RepID=A0A8H6YWT4_9AGAR|nr:hypothetical protein MSAN_00923800 [Mycena sanguinolenta]